ncbi:MAG: DUF2207 domain-containing protein [Lachnospiraceae bacterium]|nr:DUF2207 domain-containing protein [Lachnospiraceae bacterium]
MSESSKNKIFKTERLNRLDRLRKKTWLIFPALSIVIILINLLNGTVARDFKDGVTLYGIVGLLLFGILAAFTMGIIPFLLAQAAIYGRCRQVRENCRFRNIQDLEYYRDKFDGLNPAAISLLEDMKIEYDKDIAACLLRYELLGIIKENEGRYVKCGETVPDDELAPSDIYLLDNMGNISDINEKWGQMVVDEAMKRGLLLKRKLPFAPTDNKKEKNKGCFTVLWIPFAIIVTLMCMYYFNYDTIHGMLDWLGSEPDNQTFHEQVVFILSGGKYLFWIGIILVMFVALMVFLLWPFIINFVVTRIGKEAVGYKRSEKENELAECIYGMKNFIHDYSYLSDADKEKLSLWDDYLIYAVVLEENKNIVNEIAERRNS